MFLWLLSFLFLITYTVVSVYSVSWHGSEHKLFLTSIVQFFVASCSQRIIKWCPYHLLYLIFSYFLPHQFSFTVHFSVMIDEKVPPTWKKIKTSRLVFQLGYSEHSYFLSSQICVWTISFSGDCGIWSDVSRTGLILD